MRTRLEIRNRVATDTRETQINTSIEEWINQTLSEINDPAWAFEQVLAMRGYNHRWSFNRRKTSLATVASTEFYQLPRDVDKISLIRQTTTPAKIRYIPDDLFYDYIPNPTATGIPKWYRVWEEEGVSVRLSVDDMIEVVSSSASDTSQTVRVTGYDTDGLLRTESISLNGTTAVAGLITFDYNATEKKPLRISKSADTTGVITVREKTADTVLVKMAPSERAPRFKIVSFYPIPSSAINLYIEYFTNIRRLEGDNDVPDFNEKWFWIVRLGAMAKVYQYQGKLELFTATQGLYASAVRSMVKSDLGNIDFIPYLRSSLQNIGQRDILDLVDLPLGS